MAAESLQKRSRELYEQLVLHMLDSIEYGVQIDTWLNKASKVFGRSQARIESGFAPISAG